MFSRTKKIFGTTLEILIPKDDDFDEDKAARAVIDVFALFDEFNLIFSRFDERSELSHLNLGRRLKVSEPFFELLTFAVNLSKETDGVFNPLVDLSAIGYSHDFYENNFVKDSDHFSLDIDNIVIDNSSPTVELKGNAKIDLGGCAKGFTVDKARKILEKYFRNFLVNAGGDLYASGLFHGEKWQVGIEDPNDFEKDLQVLDVYDTAVATSGSYRRKWLVDGEKHHHIVSGKNNESVFNDVVAVTVIANTTLEADVFAKIAFILGQVDGKKFLLNKKVEGFFFCV